MAWLAIRILQELQKNNLSISGLLECAIQIEIAGNIQDGQGRIVTERSEVPDRILPFQKPAGWSWISFWSFQIINRPKTEKLPDRSNGDQAAWRSCEQNVRDKYKFSFKYTSVYIFYKFYFSCFSWRSFQESSVLLMWTFSKRVWLTMAFNFDY